VVEVAGAVTAGLPAEEAGAVVAVVAATGDIDDCRLTIFDLKSPVAVRAFIED
jgi:hypothetical protein